MRSPARTSRMPFGIAASAATFVLALAFVVPSLARAQDSASTRVAVASAPATSTVAAARIAAQLGSKLVGEQPAELFIGASATAILADPARLAAFGLRNAKAGARVTILRSGTERLRIEVDEFEPVARTRTLKLNLDGEGRLSVVTP